MQILCDSSILFPRTTSAFLDSHHQTAPDPFGKSLPFRTVGFCLSHRPAPNTLLRFCRLRHRRSPVLGSSPQRNCARESRSQPFLTQHHHSLRLSSRWFRCLCSVRSKPPYIICPSSSYSRGRASRSQSPSSMAPCARPDPATATSSSLAPPLPSIPSIPIRSASSPTSHIIASFCIQARQF
jgi:hypothetical protein